MNALTSVLNKLPNIPIPGITNDPGQTIYKVIVYGGTIYGGVKGFGVWLDWLSRAKDVEITKVPFLDPKMINPILNIGRKAGYMTWFTVSSASISGFISATFPVSVPALMFFSEEKQH
jgi:hypothetical protein